MILYRIGRTKIAIFNPRSYYDFSRKYNSQKSKYQNKFDDFEQNQKQHAKEQFEQYRKQFEKDTIIRNFRKQIFQKNRQPVGMKQMDTVLDNQQKHLEKLLQNGPKQKINKYSKKIMQHIANKKQMFKSKSSSNVFRDYADYSVYKSNKASIQDRNYPNMDILDRSNTQRKTYQFIDSLPENYAEKRQVRQQIEDGFPVQAQNMSISELGKFLQSKHERIQRLNELNEEKSQQNQFKMVKPQQDYMNSMFDTLNQQLDTQSMLPFQSGMLSSQALNKIYDLYLQGWSVREISRRFGILPTRTKFCIWSRARLYNQILPKHGIQFMIKAQDEQENALRQSTAIDYGLDLELMRRTQRYEQIISWTKDRVDALRSADKYTESLEKLQGRKKFGKYDIVEVGTDGKQNKKHLLKEWKIHRGKKSNDYFLKNKIFKNLMFENRKTKKVYY